MDYPKYNLVKPSAMIGSHNLITHAAYYVREQTSDFKGMVR